jgi:hypothetical protein
MTVVQERCTRSPAVIVEKRLKFLSNQMENVQSIVRNAIKSTGHHVGSRYRASKALVACAQILLLTRAQCSN